MEDEVVDLALKINKFVHSECNDAPHDIGLRIAEIVKSHQKALAFAEQSNISIGKNPSAEIYYSVRPITHDALISYGYSQPLSSYYCPPPPAHAGIYRLEYVPTRFNGKVPISGSEQWRAYLPDDNGTFIKSFCNLNELNYFHKGMCGAWLF